MSVIKKIQSEVESHIETFFPEKVKVMSRLRGDITNNITSEISKCAMVVMVFPPMIAGVKPNIISAVAADSCTIEIRIVEAPALNESGVDAYDALETIIAAFPFKTSMGQNIYLLKCESADPDNAKIVEFAIELSFACTFEKSQKFARHI